MQQCKGKGFKLIDKVRRYIESNNMIEKGESVVVGVSGGADSMCLLCVLIELGIKVYVVHINHMLRGKDAENDMAYVENFCKSRGIRCYSFSYDVDKIAKENRLSCEEAGRKVRYEAFYKVMEETGSSRIAVAHNACDNAETILHNLFRGTGMKGLAGIPAKRSEIIRPLLCADREEIVAYLEKNGIEYRNDYTNFQDIYTRNKIRNNVLSYAKENINNNVVEHISLAGKIMGDADDFIEKEGEKAYETIAIVSEGSVEIPNDKFSQLHIVIKQYIIRRALEKISLSLKDITYTNICDIEKLFEKGVGKSINLPYGVNARKTYDSVIIEGDKEKNSDGGELWIEIDGPGEYHIDGRKDVLVISGVEKKEWELMEDKYEEKTYTKWLDCDILGRKLVLRTRKTGDYIVVDSRGSRKKIKDLFIDLKIPKDERDKILLLADGKEVLWIIGYRINYNCRVTDSTGKIVKIEYKKEI